jgi:phage-related protein
MTWFNSIYDKLKQGYKNFTNSKFMNTVFDGGRKVLDVGAKGIKTLYDGIRTAKDFATNLPVIGNMVKPYASVIDGAGSIVDGISGGMNNAKNLLNNVQRGDFTEAQDTINGLKNDFDKTNKTIQDYGIKNRNLLM